MTHKTVMKFRKIVHTSPKNTPLTDLPGDSHNACEPQSERPAIFTKTFTAEMAGTMQNFMKICARRYLDVLVSVGIAQMTTCQGRGKGWFSRARMNKLQGSASACKAGQGRARRGWLTFSKMDLVAEVVGRGYSRRRGCGVKKHH